MSTFYIEDSKHCEQMGKYNSLSEALAELRRYAELRWDERPNAAPCTSWRTCGRTYEIIEYDNSVMPGKEVERTSYLEISSAGVKWHCDPVRSA